MALKGLHDGGVDGVGHSHAVDAGAVSLEAAVVDEADSLTQELCLRLIACI